MGEGESATTDNVFHIMNAVERTSAKFRTCWRNCRGLASAGPMKGIIVNVGEEELGVGDRGVEVGKDL